MGQQEEQVLITANRPSIHYSTGDYFHFQPGGNEAWIDEVLQTVQFVDRWMAEQDATTLQIIPYVILMAPDHKVFSYQRRGGGEKRLDGKHSIGVGGHVNKVDRRRVPGTKKGSKSIGWGTVEAGALREITEETHIDPRWVKEKLRMVGTIYTPVLGEADVSKPGPTAGQVHIGIVYVLPIDSEVVMVKEEDQFANYRFVNKPSDLDKYERWSQLVFQNINIIREHISKEFPKRLS